MVILDLVLGIFYIVEGILVLVGAVTLTPITIACACFCAGLGFLGYCIDHFKED